MIQQRNMFLTDKEFASLRNELNAPDLKFIERPQPDLLIYGYNWIGREANEIISLKRIDGIVQHHKIIDKSIDS